MRVAKWGNSLAVRIPASVVEALRLQEGTEISIRIAGKREFQIELDQSRLRALEGLRKFRHKLPADFRFDREEANAR